MYDPRPDYNDGIARSFVLCGVEITPEVGDPKIVPCRYYGEPSEDGEQFTVEVDEAIANLHLIDSEQTVHKEDLYESYE